MWPTLGALWPTSPAWVRSTNCPKLPHCWRIRPASVWSYLRRCVGRVVRTILERTWPRDGRCRSEYGLCPETSAAESDAVSIAQGCRRCLHPPTVCWGTCRRSYKTSVWHGLELRPLHASRAETGAEPLAVRVRRACLSSVAQQCASLVWARCRRIQLRRPSTRPFTSTPIGQGAPPRGHLEVHFLQGFLVAKRRRSRRAGL